MLCAGLLASAFAGHQVRQNIEQAAAKDYAFVCDQVTLRIRERLGSYALVLRGAAALFATTSKVGRDDWRDYVKTLRADGSVPGVQGIGFAQLIPAQQLASHIARIRGEGFPDYAVRPAGERPDITSIIYLEPFHQRNLLAFGYDMFSEPVRRAAMERARDSGEATLTGKVKLVQETHENIQAGALMYVAVYRNGAATATVEQRRQALIGWTYSPYRMNDFTGSILDEWLAHEGKINGLAIYAGRDASPADLLFNSQTADPANAHPLLYQQRTVDFNNTRWLLVFDGALASANISHADAWGVLLGGLALSLLLSSLILLGIRDRAHASRLRCIALVREQNEEQLKRQTERLQLATRSAQIGVWEWNITTNELVWDRKMFDLFGLRKEDFSGAYAAWLNSVHPEDRVRCETTVRQALQQGSLYEHEFRICRPDGSVRWIHSSAEIFPDADGAPLRVVGTDADITERKRAVQVLSESERRFNLFMDALPAAAFIKDQESRHLYFNRYMMDTFGSQNWLGKSNHEIFPPELAEELSAEDARSLAEGSRVTEEAVSGKDGRARIFQTYRFRISRPEQPPLLGGIAWDVTGQRQMEEDRRHSENKFRMLFELSPVGMALVDHQTGAFLDANKAVLQQTGYTKSEFLALNYWDITPREYEAQELQQIRDLNETGRFGPNEKEYIRKDGSRYPLRISGAVFTDVSARPIVWGVIEDITEDKKAEAELDRHRSHLELMVQERTLALNTAKDVAEAANRAKTIFLANMSHELRTPMNGIMGMTDLALRRATDPKQKDQLAMAGQSSRRLLALINDILDISKIEAEHLRLEQSDFTLSEILENLSNLTGPDARAKGLALDIDIAPDLASLPLRGDALRLGQILINLTSNAIKFTDDGSVSVRILVAEDNPTDVLLRLEVRDTGIGIPEEAQKRVFDPFEQADGSMTRKYGGTGLGLAISKRLARAMGGDIRVESRVGTGSSFRATVRLNRGAEAAGIRPAADVDAETLIRQGYSGCRILVVDDELVTREITRTLLEDIGLLVDVAVDGAEAIAMAQKNACAAIFMDMQMPNLNGLEATQLIRQLPGYRHTPIIAMTANAFAEDKARCIEAGMDDFLIKPFNPAELFATLLRSLSRRDV